MIFAGENDIALIKLSSPISCSKQIQIACLATQEPQNGEKCTATGWGRLEVSALKKVIVKIISREKKDCVNSTNMICARFKKRKQKFSDGDNGCKKRFFSVAC